VFIPFFAIIYTGADTPGTPGMIPEAFMHPGEYYILLQ
jgi:hypothetical protein